VVDVKLDGNAVRYQWGNSTGRYKREGRETFMNTEESKLPSHNSAWEGETGAIRHLILPFLEGAENVCDIGFGGVRLIPEAIGIDLPHMYNNREHIVTPDIACDVREGIPVEDSFFDVCYSSHLIEDFVDTAKMLDEFIRILKNNGILALAFPDQKVYESLTPDEVQNRNHVHKDMGLAFMKNVLSTMVKYKFDILLESNCEPQWLPAQECFSEHGGYNVVIVAKVQKEF
tara:strand:- start:84038 stop:84727 length:690 start_codon:yes stop_codon:yes gene_type:complete